MALSMIELAQAREITGSLLSELGLETYLFEIEPGEDYWEIKLDCAMEIDGGWESTSLPITKEILLASHEDAELHEQILEAWRKKLVECKLLKNPPSPPLSLI